MANLANLLLDLFFKRTTLSVSVLFYGCATFTLQTMSGESDPYIGLSRAMGDSLGRIDDIGKG